MPMRRNSTLIYVVNYFQPGKSELKKGIKSINNETSMELKMPSEKSIENILNFARVYEVLETERAGQVEMILN